MGLLQFCGNFQFVYRAEHYVTSGLVAVMYALLMAPNAILARIFLGARMTGRFLAGTGGGGRHRPADGAGISQRPAIGRDGCGAGRGLCHCGNALRQAANVLQASPVGRKQAVVPLIAWAMLFGAVIDAVLAMGLYGAPELPASPRFWGGVGWLAVMGSVVTFPVYFSLIRSIGPGRAAYSNAVVPIVAMALSTLFEGYHWTMLAVVGAVVTLSGVLIALSGRKG
jgi:drug/metabolite transporter (DMT)-like permease